MSYSPPKLNGPVVQLWSFSDAPEHVLRMLPDKAEYEWVAEIPAELAGTEIVDFLIASRDSSGSVRVLSAPDGSLILAGGKGAGPVGSHRRMSERLDRAQKAPN